MTVLQVLATQRSRVLTNQLRHVDTDVARVQVTWLGMEFHVSVQPISLAQQVLCVTIGQNVN